VRREVPDAGNSAGSSNVAPQPAPLPSVDERFGGFTMHDRDEGVDRLIREGSHARLAPFAPQPCTPSRHALLQVEDPQPNDLVLTEAAAGQRDGNTRRLALCSVQQRAGLVLGGGFLAAGMLAVLLPGVKLLGY
jgi:hypothetical protein